MRIISAGRGEPDWRLAWKRLGSVAGRLAVFQPVFRFRFWPSLFHALVGWGFGLVILIDLIDVAQGYGRGSPSRVLRGCLPSCSRTYFGDSADRHILFVIRRFVVRPANLSTRETILLQPRRASASNAIRPSWRLLSYFKSVRVQGPLPSIAAGWPGDVWQPVASGWRGCGRGGARVLALGEHIAFWLSIGPILAFIPYFPYSKHLHLFFAPLNFLLKPERRSIGELSYINLDDQSIEQFGAPS